MSIISIKRALRVPVLPGLHAIAIQEEVQGLPVVVDLVTVMHNIERSRDQTGC